MIKTNILIAALFAFLLASTASAMEGMDHEKDGTGHDNMNHGSETMDGTFKHAAMAGNTHAEFQVMDLASMNIKDPAGNTHHVMATFNQNGEKLEKVVGKVKMVSPSGKEQLASLEDFGSGVFAANFTINEPGKWGVICLFKAGEEQHAVKFWYPHMAM